MGLGIKLLISVVLILGASDSLASKGHQMEKVTGIGGFFFRSENPNELAKWYLEHLGVDLVPQDYETPPWQQEAGPTVFAPFPKDSAMIPQNKTWMINFRVKDLKKMVEQLETAGIKVTVDPEKYPNGSFATLQDPEGNGIQLWEPK